MYAVCAVCAVGAVGAVLGVSRLPPTLFACWCLAARSVDTIGVGLLRTFSEGILPLRETFHFNRGLQGGLGFGNACHVKLFKVVQLMGDYGPKTVF